MKLLGIFLFVSMKNLMGMKQLEITLLEKSV